eukprot:TRINITY_DN2432_c0_g1_i2.p1 TRINITY_DN2432_c0_g1~~TRINITY_DN2432_c0_g1_i2.p1  ORF type:complete len:571 (+),score=149.13 TRINITY_DN2432_c0_g1_i2:165-1877(+)
MSRPANLDLEDFTSNLGHSPQNSSCEHGADGEADYPPTPTSPAQRILADRSRRVRPGSDRPQTAAARTQTPKTAFNDNGPERTSESNDRRTRRLQHAGIYTKAVKECRERLEAQEPQLNPNTSKVSVNVRVRPLFEHEASRGEWECISGSSTAGIAMVHEATEKVKRGLGKIPVMRNHTFQCAEFLGADITDEELYHRTAAGLTEQALSGKSSTIFMYGMTGSGKTYSMSAIHSLICPQLWELHPSLMVTFTSFEMIGKRCFDLLATQKPHPEVVLRMGEDHLLHACGATTVDCATPSELQDQLLKASAARETCATGTNATSSRSHAVYKLQLLAEDGQVLGAVTMIDLAGNEGTIESFYHSKEQMAETAEINSSLSVLKECLAARARGDAHVPYRQSTLTRVLQGALSSDSAFISVVATLSPASTHMEQSLNTLKTVATLTGGSRKPSVEERELSSQEDVKARLVPQKWDSKQLNAWIAKSKFRDTVKLPAGMNGATLMKLTALRLGSHCANAQIAQELFNAVRAEAKRVQALDAKTRQEMKQFSQKMASTSSYGFAKAAPSKPVASRK